MIQEPTRRVEITNEYRAALAAEGRDSPAAAEMLRTHPFLHDEPTHEIDGPTLREGDMVGPFRVEALIGLGGMGAVYRAMDTALRRPVAVKVLLAGRPEDRQRFLREARLAAAIRHDNIVPVHQVGEADGLPFLVMPLLEGEALADRLLRQPALTVAEALHIGAEVAEGLAAAHDGGLIHRDVKPANIWIDTSGRALLLDFGVARGQGDEGLTRVGALVGTPAYMSPEQVDGGELDGRSDLFSLGSVLFRILTGRNAFGRATLSATLRAVGQEEAGQLAPSVPRPLAALVSRLLAKKRDARPKDARAAAAALRAIDPAPRRRAPWIAAALPLLLAGGAVAWALRPSAPPPPGPDPEPPAEPVGSVLDRLSPVAPIPRYPWHPPELIRVIGEERGALWSTRTRSQGTRAIFLTPDEKHLLTDDGDALDAQTLTFVSGHPALKAGVPLAFHPLHPTQAIYPDGRLRDFNTGVAIGDDFDIRRMGQPHADFSPDGRWVAFQANMNGALFRVAPRPARLLEWDDGVFPEAGGFDFDADGKRLAIIREKGQKVVIYDTSGDTPREATSIPLKRQAGGVRFLRGGLLAVANQFAESLPLWDVAARPPRVAHSLKPLPGGVGFLFPFADRGLLGISSGSATMALALEGGTLRAAAPPVVIDSADGGTNNATASADGKTLWLRGREGVITRVRLGAGPPAPEGDRFQVRSLDHPATLTADGTNLALLQKGGQLAFVPLAGGPTRVMPGGWDSRPMIVFPGGVLGRETARNKHQLIEPGPPPRVAESFVQEVWRPFAVSPDGRAVVGADPTDRLQIHREGRGTKTLDVPVPAAYAVCFSPDAARCLLVRVPMAEHQAESPSRLLDLSGDEPRVERSFDLPKAFCAAITPDLATVALGVGNGVRFHDARTGAALPLAVPLPHLPGWLDYSPDGRWLLSSANVGEELFVAIWDAASGKLRKKWKFPGAALARFAPDGRHVITRNKNGTVYILRYDPAAR